MAAQPIRAASRNESGALSTYICVTVVVTSYFRARFSFRAWKIIHYTAYILAPALIWHTVFSKPTLTEEAIDFLDGGKVFAQLVSLLIAGAVIGRGWLVWRRKRSPSQTAFTILRDDGAITPVWRGELCISAVRDETPDVKTFVLTAPDQKELPFIWLPGQYLTVHLQGVSGQYMTRNYTISSSPTRNHSCEITVKRGTGFGSRLMHENLQVGNCLEVSAPHGDFVFTGSEAPKIVLIGGGVGVTPLISILRYLIDVNWRGKIHLLYSVPTPQDVIFNRELNMLAQLHPQLQLTVFVTREAAIPWNGKYGRISSEMLAAIPDLATSRIYLCGPEAMMVDIGRMLEDLFVPSIQIHTEAFTPATQTPGKARRPTDDGVLLTFASSGQTVHLTDGETLLAAAERCGVAIESSCRKGQCGSCRVRIVVGTVHLGAQSVLSETDIAHGDVLACVCRGADSNVVIQR